MSRWFRHYSGMMRDEKLVSAAVRSKQPVERVVWVWGAILESASEINDGGRYELDAAEVAYFLRADEADISSVIRELEASGRLASGVVVHWCDRQYESDASAKRQAAYRERKRSGGRNGDVTVERSDVTPPSRDGEVTPQDTDTDTDTEERDMSETSSDKPDLLKAKRTRTEYHQDFLAFYTAYPSDPGMSKAEAFKAWGKLSPDEQAKASAAIPAFKVWVGKQGKDYRTVHACRYLSQKRFDGFDAVQSSQPTITLYPVRRDSPEWRAWCEHKGVSSHVDTDLRDVDGHIIGRGWMFPSQWPPDHEARAA